jgi:hypothetical protein
VILRIISSEQYSIHGTDHFLVLANYYWNQGCGGYMPGDRGILRPNVCHSRAANRITGKRLLR